MKITLDSFRQVIKQSGLVDDDVLESESSSFEELVRTQSAAAGDGPKPRVDAKTFAQYLVDKGVLSVWQAENLLKGKHKGFRLGKYRLLSLLGKGGMSSVYLAEHTVMKRRVAIKVLPHKKVNDASYLGRFHREAQAVAALDHPNIVRAYDVDAETDGAMEIHFLVMEYVEGKSLQELVAKVGKVKPLDAADYVQQAAEGLEHAHAAGLVHRDIKPGNLLLDKNGTVKLLDLGLARFFGDEENSLTVEHDEKVLGTADYLAPEQAVDSHSVDHRADLYSLGCTLYFLLTGQPPFNQGTLAQRLIAHQTKNPSPVADVRDDVPESLINLMNRLMSKKPEERPETAGEAAKEFAAWLEEAKNHSTKPTHVTAAVGGGVATEPAAPRATEPEDAFGSFLNQLDSGRSLQTNIDLGSNSGVGPLAESALESHAKPEDKSTVSSNIHGSGPSSILASRKSKVSPAVVYGGGGAAAVLIIAVCWILFFSGGSNEPSNSTQDLNPRIASPEGGGGGNDPTPPARPAVTGDKITVGPDGNFGTLGEAVAYVRSSFVPFDSSETRTIQLAAGETFDEILAIDASGLDAFPRFVTIEGDAGQPATLRGDGQTPVLSLSAIEHLTIRNLVLDAGGSTIGVALSGFMSGTSIENCRLQNFRNTGVEATGVAGLGTARIRIDGLTVRPSDDRTPVVGIKLVSAIPETAEIEITNTRIQGPMTAGLEIVGGTKNVWVRRCIFESLESGVSFPAVPADFERIQLIGNTFHDVETAIAFAVQPASTSGKLAIAQNLFTNVDRELVVSSKLDRNGMNAFFSNGGWRSENYSTMAKGDVAEDEFQLVPDAAFGRPDANYVSTDRDDPNYLKPQADWLKQAGGGDDAKFVGAVKP